MTTLVRNIVDSFAAGSLAISVVLTALRPATHRTELRTAATVFDPDVGPFSYRGSAAPWVHDSANLLGIASQPTNAVLWALLVAVLVALALHLLLPAPAGSDERAGGWSRPAGLAAAAVWPWVLNPLPLVGLAMAAGSIVLLVRGLSLSQGQQPSRKRAGDLPLAFVAGWLLMAASSGLGMYVHHRLGLGLERSVLLGLLVASLAGAWAQLRMDGIVTWSLALIWAMIGFAAAAAGASITIATACVLGIAALTVVVVRVTT